LQNLRINGAQELLCARNRGVFPCPPQRGGLQLLVSRITDAADLPLQIIVVMVDNAIFLA
jgi:hypothetical protein